MVKEPNTFTTEAIEIEVAAQRRQLSNKDREIETLRQQVHVERGRVTVAKRDAELEAELREELRTEEAARNTLQQEQHERLVKQKD